MPSLVATLVVVALAGSASITACLIDTSGLTGDGQMDGSVVDAPAPVPVQDAAPANDAGLDDAAVTNHDAAIADAMVQMDAGADASPYDKLVLADQPSAYWPLDEPAGSNVAIDVVGGRAASAQGSVTFGVAGAVGTCARFAGGSQLNAGDYFDLLGQDPFAIEFWMQADTNDAGFQDVIDKRQGAQKNGYVIYGVTGPQVQFEENWDNDSGMQRDGWEVVDFAASIIHVVLTLDTSDAIHLYINGVESTEEFGPGIVGGPSPNGIDLTFGGGLTGEIDAIALYNHELTAVQVNAHYQARTR